MKSKFWELLKTIEHLRNENPFITLGLRATRHESESVVGTQLRPSYNWIDGVKQKNKLDGTCTVGIESHDEVGLIRALQIMGNRACILLGVPVTRQENDYMTDESDLILVSGDSAKVGDDYGEWVIRNAKTEWSLKSNSNRMGFKEFIK